MPREKYSKAEQEKHQPFELFIGTQPLENAPFTWKKVAGYETLSPALSDFEITVKKVSAMDREDMLENYEAPRIDVEVLNKKGDLICWMGIYRKEISKFDKALEE